MYNYYILSDEKFEGLDQTKSVSYLIRNILYSVYITVKIFNIIEEPTEPILSISAYNESKKIRSHKFFGQIEKNISKIAKKHPIQLARFKLLIDDFGIISPNYLTGEQGWLFIHCAGGIFGAVYSDSTYWELICLVSKLTIENEDNPLDIKGKQKLFLDILAVFTYFNVDGNQAEKNFNFDVKIEFIALTQKNKGVEINCFDKKKIVNEYLVTALQSYG